MVVSVVVVVVGVWLTTLVKTSTTAWSGSTSSVVTRTPSGTMCTGSSTCSSTGRCSPQPEYQRESWPDRSSTRISFGASEAQERCEVDEEPRVAVGPVARVLVVDEDHRVPESALELQRDRPAGPVGRGVEGLEIGVRARRVVGAGALADRVGGTIGVAERVVRQRHRRRPGLDSLHRRERTQRSPVGPAGVEGLRRHIDSVSDGHTFRRDDPLEPPRACRVRRYVEHA